MIHDKLEQADRYAALHPRFRRAFGALQRGDLSHLPAGRQEIDGDALYMMIFRTDGTEPARPVLEAHRRYIDIQYTISGREVIGWKPLRDCDSISTPYSPEKDVEFIADKPETWLVVRPGMFALFFPEDAHAPLAGDGPVEKAVVKILTAAD